MSLEVYFFETQCRICLHWLNDATGWRSLRCRSDFGSVQTGIHSEPLKTWHFIFDYNFG